MESRDLDWMRRCRPAAAVLVLTVGLWLGFGVSASDIALFLGYEVLFLLVPGWLLYVALSGQRHSFLREVSVGWALGHVVEILAFALTASLGLRGWFPLYPLLGICASLLMMRRTAQPPQRANGSRTRDAPWVWAVAAVLAVGLVYVATTYFAQTPLPSRSGFAGWEPDLTFDLDLAAHLLHHWPLSSPELSGTPLPYQPFAYVHMASIAQVTGIRLPVVLLRLYVPPLLVLLMLQLSWAGRRLTGEAWSGPIAAILVVLIGTVDPVLTDGHAPNLVGLAFSPTFLLGMTMFIPALVLCAEQAQVVQRTDGRRRWIVLALLLVGCAGAKAAILPVLAGGLVLYGGACLIRRHQIDHAVGWLVGLIGLMFVASYWLIYGGESEGVHLTIHGTATLFAAFARLRGPFAHVPGVSALFWLTGNAIELLVAVTAQLIGLIWVLRDRDLRASPTTVLLMAVLIAGLFPWFFTSAPGGSQTWFTSYGVVAGAFLSAQGLCVLGRSLVTRSRAAIARLAVPVAGTAIAAALLSYLGYSHNFSRGLGYASWGMIVAAIAVAWFSSSFTPRGRRITVVALLPVLVYGALDVPLQAVPELVERGPEPVYANDWGIVPGGLVAGLDWIRQHTSPMAVLAVNNASLGPIDPQGHYYMFYSALSERQVYFEGWLETVEVRGPQELHSVRDRQTLNSKVFQLASPRALAELATEGQIRYLLVDKVNGTASPRLGQLANLVYRNRDVDIYAVRAHL